MQHWSSENNQSSNIDTKTFYAFYTLNSMRIRLDGFIYSLISRETAHGLFCMTIGSNTYLFYCRYDFVIHRDTNNRNAEDWKFLYDLENLLLYKIQIFPSSKYIHVGYRVLCLQLINRT